MRSFKCTTCSCWKGDYIFHVQYVTDDTDVEDDATRCPNCGTLVDSQDVKEL